MCTLIIVHHCSSVAPSNNRQIAAQSLTDSVQELLTAFMDDARARLETEVCKCLLLFSGYVSWWKRWQNNSIMLCMVELKVHFGKQSDCSIRVFCSRFIRKF